MQSAIQTYARNQTSALSPRELEAQVLLKAAAKLQALKDHWEPSISVIDEPLALNRRIWTIFLASASDPSSDLPRELRQNIIGLGRFIINQCMQMLFTPDRDKLDLLIDINRNIAAGLRGDAGDGAEMVAIRPERLAAGG
jgi:flagellar protein FlaF